MNIGIDLGTTFSVIAVKGKIDTLPGYPPGEYLEDVDVTILPAPNGDLTIPSVMWWDPSDPDRYVFGEEAKAMAEEGKAPIMFSKRCIGSNEKLVLNGRDFTAREVAARFLRHMREWAETVTGQKIARAVVTHPAYFSPGQRQETLEAAREAGFEMSPEQLIMEPCAAALAYTVNDTRDPLRVMTYDLGGGTFDVAVMEKIGGLIEMRKFHGDHLLGGYNFDSALVQWILDQLRAKGRNIPYDEANEEHRGRRARMLQTAEAVKIRLAEKPNDRVSVPVQVDYLTDDQGQRVQFTTQINRLQYAALVQDELRKTIDCCLAALAGAGFEADSLHAVLLVGGSTKGKWVADAVGAEFGNVSEPYYPDLCVAAGAALYAADLPSVNENERVKLSVDLPSVSTLPVQTVAGRVCPSEGSDLDPEACRALLVHLDTPRDGTLGPAEIGPDGHFLFSGVALPEDGSPAVFRVRVSEGSRELLAHEASTRYVEEDPEQEGQGGVVITAINPVLPRPLFLKADRMINMAAEGAKLPLKCQVKLQRNFGGSSLSIPIYLDNEQVGSVAVEGIPDEAGEDCIVAVDVEVTQHNDMRGQVRVYAPNGSTVMKEGRVHIDFPPTEIPELSELLGRFDELQEQLEMAILHAAPQDRSRLAGSGRALVKKIRKLVDGEAPERQLLHERLKELDAIVNPAEDDMDPPRREFENLVAECRELLAANPENTAFKAFGPQVDRVEAAGKEACDTKNHKNWVHANETLLRIRQRMEAAGRSDGPVPARPEPTARELKDMAERQIDMLRASLRSAREARLRAGDAEAWLDRCEECERRIAHMASQVRGIAEEAPKEQAMAQVRSYLGPAERLQKTIKFIHEGTPVREL